MLYNQSSKNCNAVIDWRTCICRSETCCIK